MERSVSRRYIRGAGGIDDRHIRTGAYRALVQKLFLFFSLGLVLYSGLVMTTCSEYNKWAKGLNYVSGLMAIRLVPPLATHDDFGCIGANGVIVRDATCKTDSTLRLRLSCSQLTVMS